MTFKPHPQAEQRRRSIALLIEVLLTNRSPEIQDKHIRDLLNTLLWKLTEADGKYTTRYQSTEAIKCKDKSGLRHDHVHPRSRMIEELLTATPEEVKRIVTLAVGCTVTLDEHLRLSRFDHHHAGWERYRAAEVEVQDTETGRLEVIRKSD